MGKGLTEEQKFDVEDVFLRVYETKIKPDIVSTIKETTSNTCEECKRIDNIDLWLGKIRLLGRDVYLSAVLILFLFLDWLANKLSP